jgi:large subunit ribosomal protein L9
MARNVQLLLTENVETHGIVGDVVNVRSGFARNYLLPRGLATTPSEEKIQALASKRAEAERMLAEIRKQREQTNEKLKGVAIELIRSTNDQGILYGAISQQEIATALNAKGLVIKPRDVRMSQAIKRVDTYDIHIKLDSDLDAIIKLKVSADRKLDLHEEKPAEEAPAPSAEQGAATEEKPAKSKKDRAEGAQPGEKEGKTPKDAKPIKEAGAFSKQGSTFSKDPGEHKPDKGGKSEKGEKPAKGKKSKGK